MSERERERERERPVFNEGTKEMALHRTSVKASEGKSRASLITIDTRSFSHSPSVGDKKDDSTGSRQGAGGLPSLSHSPSLQSS